MNVGEQKKNTIKIDKCLKKVYKLNQSIQQYQDAKEHCCHQAFQICLPRERKNQLIRKAIIASIAISYQEFRISSTKIYLQRANALNNTFWCKIVYLEEVTM